MGKEEGNPLHIAMILSTPLPPREGIGFYAWNLATQLIKRGQQVELITRGGPRPTTREEVEGITIWKPTFFPIYPLHVHIHGLFVSMLIRRLGSAIDIFHLHSPLVPVISAQQPVMLTFHSTIPLDAKLTRVESLYSVLVKLQAPVSYKLELNNVKQATCVNTVSPRVTKALQSYIGFSDKIDVMWNGVNTNTFKPAYKDRRQKRLVLTVSRLEPGKGLHDLIEAAELIVRKDPEVRFLIVGEGGMRDSLEKRIRQIGLGRSIQLTGHIFERDRLVDLYQSAALFVLPSHHEGMPTVILESMACGCPVLATSVGGIPSLIQDGENGGLIPPGNACALAQRILDLLQNPQLLTYLSKQARDMVEDRFSWEIICSRYLQQYKSMLQGVEV